MRPAPALVTLLVAVGCAVSGGPVPEEWGGYTRGYHDGPEVAYTRHGTARFAAQLLEGFDTEAAMRTASHVDQWFREPGNDGFEASLDRVLDELRRVGFGASEALELKVVETPMAAPAWTPKSASLTLSLQGSRIQYLHQFHPGDDRERTMLPVHAPAGTAEGTFALDLDELDPGEILVTREPLEDVLEGARSRGASALLSSYLFPFNVDPTGRERHLDAIHYGSVPTGTDLLVAHISPRIHALLEDMGSVSYVRLALECDVELSERPLRTVIATIVGAGRPQEEIALVAHVQEPGANDNASGVAGLLQGAIGLRRAIEAGDIPRPLRSLSFVWGDEYVASRVHLDHTTRRVLAGISVDMIGASRSETGARCLLERGPDPGALSPLPPDRHTEWGAGQVDPEWLIPSGLAIILRCAMVDVGLEAGGWETSEHPWEGGSDHDVFLGRGIPAALVWHFTDFAYHTSLDRMEFVDPEELRRTSVALISAACGVADARPEDLKRYLDSLLRERYERQGSVVEHAASEDVAHQWGNWCTNARRWLAYLCNGMDLPGGDE